MKQLIHRCDICIEDIPKGKPAFEVRVQSMTSIIETWDVCEGCKDKIPEMMVRLTVEACRKQSTEREANGNDSNDSEKDT